jgi:hypothetical protein
LYAVYFKLNASAKLCCCSKAQTSMIQAEQQPVATANKPSCLHAVLCSASASARHTEAPQNNVIAPRKPQALLKQAERPALRQRIRRTATSAEAAAAGVRLEVQREPSSYGRKVGTHLHTRAACVLSASSAVLQCSSYTHKAIFQMQFETRKGPFFRSCKALTLASAAVVAVAAAFPCTGYGA